MKIRAFNLVPGAVIKWTGRYEPYIIHEVVRDEVTEAVSIVDVASASWETFDYNDEVELVGLTPNHEVPGEDDFGTATVDPGLGDYRTAYEAAIGARSLSDGSVRTRGVLSAYGRLRKSTQYLVREEAMDAMKDSLYAGNLVLSRSHLLIHQSLASGVAISR